MPTGPKKKTKRICLKKVLKKNPQVNVRKLTEVRILMKKMQKLGIRKRGYRLALPYSRKRAVLSPRPYTVQLHNI